MSGTDSRDGQTDRRATAGRLRHRNVLDQVAMELSLKTEAPGLHGMGQAPGPQAWPGTSLCHPAPVPTMYSRKSYVGGARGQAKAAGGGRGKVKRRKQEGQGRGQAGT